nr:GTPase HflX [Pseudomonadota bacterium]
VLADTVGFIRHLPHELIAAFRATLQETCEASLLVQVIDAADPEHRAREEQVEQVLADIGAGAVPRIRAYNKIDRLDVEPRLERDAGGRVQAVWLSAARSSGLDLLAAAIAERLGRETVHGWVRVPPEAGRLRARLFSLGAVLAERLATDGAWMIEVQTSRSNLQQLCRQEDFREEWLQPVS